MSSKSPARLLVAAVLAATVLLPAASGRVAASNLVPAAATAAAPTHPVVNTPGAKATVAYTKPRREVFGFFNGSNMANPNVGWTTWDFNTLTTLAFFGLHVYASDGSFQFDSSWDRWNSTDLANLVSGAHAYGVKVVPSILLHDFSSTQGGTVNTRMCQGLAAGAATHTIGNIKSEVAAKNADGVNIDYEGEDQLCPNGLYLHQMLDSMVQQLRAAMPNTYISIATYNASYQGGYFDIAGLNPYVDSFFLMDYDSDGSNYHYEPLVCATYCFSPTAPLNSYYYNDSNSVAGYLGLVPASKVILGVPYYGYTACIPGDSRPGPNAVPYTDSRAYWVAPTYLDSTSMVGYYDAYNYSGPYRDPFTRVDPYSTWYSKNYGCWRESYWDDTVSYGAKYDLINRNNLRGVGIFTLDYGGGAPELWQLLQGKFGGCAVPTLTMSATSPAAVGGTVNFASSTSNCPAPIYAFWVQTPGGVWDEVQGYSSSGSWSWNTYGLLPGTYNVVVWVKNNGGDANQYDTFATTTITFTGCATVGLDTATPTPQAVGSSYSFTGTTTGCPNPEYQFWLQPTGGLWRVVQPYSPTSTWSWNTAGWVPGTYNLAVWIRQHGSGNAYDQGGGGPFTLSTCSSASVSPAPGSYNGGGTIALTASAAGCPNPEYAFWIRPPGGLWSVAQGYSSNATLNWNTSGFTPATFQIAIWVRQHGSGTPAGYDTAAGGSYALTGCASVSLSASPTSPAPHGTSVAVTAAASGCGTPQYSFWYKPINGGLWKQAPYGASGSWSWNTAGLAAGGYYVVVWARQAGSANGYDTSSYLTYTLT